VTSLHRIDLNEGTLLVQDNNGEEGMGVFGVLIALLGAWVVTASAAYPERPLRMIVSSAPGGGPDIASRLIAAQLSNQIGQQVVVDNRLGGSGVIGMEALSRSTPDGYTFGQANFTTINTNRILMPKLPYNADKAFEALIFAYMSNNMLAVNNAMSISSVADLIAYASAIRQLLYGAGAPTEPAFLRIVQHHGRRRHDRRVLQGILPRDTRRHLGQIQLIYDNINSFPSTPRSGACALGVTSPGAISRVSGRAQHRGTAAGLPGNPGPASLRRPGCAACLCASDCRAAKAMADQTVRTRPPAWAWNGGYAGTLCRAYQERTGEV
jgi:hypothetical protein